MPDHQCYRCRNDACEFYRCVDEACACPCDKTPALFVDPFNALNERDIQHLGCKCEFAGCDNCHPECKPGISCLSISRGSAPDGSRKDQCYVQPDA